MSVYRLGGGRERRANIEDPSRAVVMAFSRRCGVGEIRQLITQRRLRNRVIERSVIRQKLSSFDAISHIQRSEEHTSELQSLMRISYAVFCLQTKKQYITIHTQTHTANTT